MAIFKPIDTKREQFRQYLERAGVLASLTNVLTALHEEKEKPADPLGYVIGKLVAAQPGSNGSDIIALKEENARLKELLAQYEGSGSKTQTPHRSNQSVHSDTSSKKQPE